MPPMCALVDSMSCRLMPTLPVNKAQHQTQQTVCSNVLAYPSATEAWHQQHQQRERVQTVRCYLQ